LYIQPRKAAWSDSPASQREGTIDLSPTRIRTDVDFDRDGRTIGDLKVRYSDDRYASGYIPVPIAVLKNGAGPTVLLAAGNHGDEYEGQIALMKVIHALDLASLRGRLIVLPTLNAPAVWAARRTSPIDGQNFNRAFPGNRDGGPTAMLAHFVESVLLPACDAAIDLHSGGRASYYSPCAYITRGRDAAVYRASLALGAAFGLPLTLLLGALNEDRSFNAAAERQGVPMMATELGGGASVSRGIAALAEQGIMRSLRHLGVVDGPPPPAAVTRYLELRGESQYVYAPSAGVFEPAIDIGQDVAAGDLAGFIHHVSEIARPASELRFAASGCVFAGCAQGLVERGAMLATVGCDARP
jgi:predicted deacylase